MLNVIDAEQRAGELPGGDRRPRRPDPAQAGRPAARRSWCSAPARRRSTWPRTASAGTPCAPGSRSPSRPAARPPTSRRRWRSSSGSATRCSCGPATCSAAGPWRSSTTTTSLARAMAELAGFGSLGREGGLSAERPVLDRPLPRGRHRGRRRRHPRPHRRGADRRGHGARRGGRRALRRLGLRHPAATRSRPRRSRCIEAYTRRIAEALDVRGLINVQYAVKAEPGVRDRGQPAGHRGRCRSSPRPPACRWPRWPPGSCSAPPSPSCATRACCARRSAGDHVAVKEAVLPFNRFPDADTAARPRDALHGRGHGHRPHRSAWPSPRASSRRATGCRAGHGVPLAGRPRQGRSACVAAATLRRARLRHRRHRRAPPRTSRRTASRSPRWSPSSASATGTDAVELIAGGQGRAGGQQPAGPGARADGDHIRAAAGAHQVPLLTTAAAGAGRRQRAWPTGPATSSGCARCRSTTAASADELELRCDRSARAVGRRRSGLTAGRRR